MSVIIYEERHIKGELLVALCLVWFAQAAFASAISDRWKIGDVHLAPRTEIVTGLTVEIADRHRGGAFRLSADVVLSEVRDSVLYGDRLALIGRAGNTEAVAVFDLERRKEIDWFYCSGAKQIMPGKIVLTMWEPNHPLYLGDVLLMLYDLTKSPSANRSRASSNAHYPLPVEDQGEETMNVGTPIYPQHNADEGSYERVVHESEEAILGADLNTMVAVSPERLVFVADKGLSADWLEVLDLPHGAAKAKSRRIEIPGEQLQRDPVWLKNHPGINPRWVEISKIEVISPKQVRLHVPVEVYGIDHLDMQIADGQ